jgi:hypothetical protein
MSGMRRMPRHRLRCAKFPHGPARTGAFAPTLPSLASGRCRRCMHRAIASRSWVAVAVSKAELKVVGQLFLC